MNSTAVQQHLQELELALLRPAVRQNHERLSLMLADDFREFGSSGRIFDKSAVIQALSTEREVHFSISDFRADVLPDGVALVTYRAVRRDGAEEIASLRSSLWIVRHGQWKMLFHQGTKVVVENAAAIAVKNNVLDR